MAKWFDTESKAALKVGCGTLLLMIPSIVVGSYVESNFERAMTAFRAFNAAHDNNGTALAVTAVVLAGVALAGLKALRRPLVGIFECAIAMGTVTFVLNRPSVTLAECFLGLIGAMFLSCQGWENIYSYFDTPRRD